MKLIYFPIFAAVLGVAIAGSAGVMASTINGTIDPVSGFQTTSAPIGHSTINDGDRSISIATGTTAYSANMTVNGKSRRYVVLRPTATTANAPVLLLLHPHGTSPEETSNLTEVADYVLTQGFWAVLPEALGSGWDDDPSSKTNNDLPFISALIDALIAQGSVDPTRIYASGFSSGGFMTERLACDLSDKIAAFGVDAATLRGHQVAACTPAKLRSKVYFLGTADFIVSYNGVFPNGANGLGSAETTLSFWAKQQACGGFIANTIPNRVSDGTSVQQNVYTGCLGDTALQLYTIDGGGHAWPGGKPSYVGKTTQNIAATGLIWRFVSPTRR